MAKLLLMFLLFSGLQSRAEISSRASVDLGFTDNANLSSDNKQSDTFYRAMTSNKFLSGSHTYNLRLSYLDYVHQNSNDNLFLTAEDSWGDLKELLFSASLVGQYYPNGNAATTETAFNNYGLNFKLAKGYNESEQREGDYGAGYRFRYYPSFDGRNDHNGFGFGSLTYEATQLLSLIAYGEAGLTYSSLPDYNRAYAEVTGSVEYLLPSRWTWSNEVSLGRSHFLNRSVTTQTAVPFKQGRGGLRTSRENEKYTNLSLTSEAMRAQTDAFEWGGDISLANQNSLSGLQNYTAFVAEAKLTLTF